MTYTCRSCGGAVDENVNYCPHCGALITVNADGSTYNYNNTAANGNSNNNAGSSNSGILKTAAIAGGAVLGASALTGIARNLTHRRRPPYTGMGGGRPPMGPPPGGHGGMGGPGGPGGGRMM